MKFRGYDLYFEKGNYMNNNIAVQSYTEEGELYATITVNLVDLNGPFAYIDVNNIGYDLYNTLIQEGLIKETGDEMPSGFCIYPLCDITKLLEICK